jgi:hypothetical protein
VSSCCFAVFAAFYSGIGARGGKPAPLNSGGSAPGPRTGECKTGGAPLTILGLACREDVPGFVGGLGWAHPHLAITLGTARAFPVPRIMVWRNRLPDKQGGKDKQQEANLGQKEAREEKEKKSELSSLGEGFRESSHDHNQKRDSD